MKNPKCNSCKKEISLLGSMKSLSLIHIVCPHCEHKNKLNFKYCLLWLISGLFTGICVSSLKDSNLVFTSITALLAIGFMVFSLKKWHRIIA